MTPENRLSIFHNWLAPLLGTKGWEIIAAAMDPKHEHFQEALNFCKTTALAHGKGWPHQWPQP